MKKIIYSAGVIVSIAALAITSTGAFFSDTETSTGNTFTAGDIDLQIDNESYAIDYNIPGFPNPTGAFVEATTTSWQLTDLTIEKFFFFDDLKPGDYGEDTISVHVGSNDAWMCAAARITLDDDNGITEPEDEVAGANNDNNDGTSDGDLDSELNFAFWVDDGDNVLEQSEETDVFLQGPLSGLNPEGKITLADSAGGILGVNTPIPGDSTFYIGKMWCFGELTPAPVADGNNDPLVATGWTCDGSAATNIAQTDQVVGDLQFFAEQSRHNGQFLCSQWDPRWPGEQVGPSLE